MEFYSFEEEHFLGNRLRELRLTFGFKQEDIARALNVSRSTYSYYEIGTTRPDPAVLGKLSVYYNVPVSFFYEKEIVVKEALYDAAGRRRRTSRTAAVNPQKVGELLPAERSLVLFLRANGINAKDALESLEAHVEKERQKQKAARAEEKAN
ncbi:helix-turn-helix domain-containing protein [uncultured Neglectibacter sp.]|uniref:helix-turn-helix domain-containing protein n=1 Tax=uncultured Neglectibacter sp. TaxID=1924108 RepID=UPI0034E04588